MSFLARVLCLALALSACAARPLTETERAFAGSVMGSQLDADRVRIVKGSVSGLVATEIPPRPRTSCRELIRPPHDEPLPGAFAAMVLGRTVFYMREFWQADFVPAYPAAMELAESMRLAHELTHVWQWQRRALTGYSPLKALWEHVEENDPYLVRIDPTRRFLSYPYEQQATIVEELVCCRALDPKGARTAALGRLVGEVFPETALTSAVDRRRISLPWAGARIEGICS